MVENLVKLINETHEAVKHIRLAERHILKEDIAEKELIKSSYHFNQLEKMDIVLYNNLIKMYDDVHNQYIALYHKRVKSGFTPKTLQENDEDNFAWTSNKIKKSYIELNKEE